MSTVIIALSRYLLAIFAAFFALHCFAAFSYSFSYARRWFCVTQVVFMSFIHLLSFSVMALQTGAQYLALICVLHEMAFIITILMYRIIYPDSSWLLLNNMCFFLSVGLIMITRLSPEKALKQFFIALIALLLTFFIPMLLKKAGDIRKYGVYFGIAGFAALAAVFVFGSITNGSRLSIQLFSIPFQPSEFVKIAFVLFEAAMLTEEDKGNGNVRLHPNIKRITVSAAAALAYCIILVLSRDLGGAVIFFVAYIFMLYIALKAPLVLAGGALAGAAGTFIGYRLFSHVRVRFRAWRNPFSEIEGQGYQITQSLFAIGTGGWFGMGLTMGSPDKIPVVEQDFIFSAVSEELGCIFSICLILVCISTFLMFMNIAMKTRNAYFKLTAAGLAVVYIFQVFLTVGGTVKFIPLTGVTLPLVSYGGSSLLATLIMFALIQGVYSIEE